MNKLYGKMRFCFYRQERRDVKQVIVMGLGYIGLPTAVILAANAYRVTGVDRDIKLLQELEQGKIHIEEPNLNLLFQQVRSEKKLRFSPQPENADIFIIAVPTPARADKSCDMTNVLQAVESILPQLQTGNLLIIESTIPPLSCEEIIKPLLEEAGHKVGENLFLAFCPERVLPGDIVRELLVNNRVIGGFTRRCAQEAAKFYGSFLQGEISLSDLKTAEMTKLLENTFRDVNIALVNEMTRICSHLGIDVLEVIRLANKHPRVKLLQPGPGVGGHCLAVDPYFIVEKAPSLTPLIKTAREVNASMPAFIVEKVQNLVAGMDKPHIAVFGLSYKGNIGDLRESPAWEIVKALRQEGYSIKVFDPHVRSVSGENSAPAAVKDSDLILILTEHDEFRHLDYDELAADMRTPLVFDTRNIIPARANPFSRIRLCHLGNT